MAISVDTKSSLTSETPGCSTPRTSSLPLEETVGTPFALTRTLLSSLLCYWPLENDPECIQRIPSLLLCGDSGSGKTYVWQRVVSSLREEKQQFTGFLSTSAHEEEMGDTNQERKENQIALRSVSGNVSRAFSFSPPLDVMVIQPALSQASLYTGNNSMYEAGPLTPLRRLIHKEVSAQCKHHRSSSMSTSSPTEAHHAVGETVEGTMQQKKKLIHPSKTPTPSGVSLLLVLDHLELFCLEMEEWDRDRDNSQENAASRLTGNGRKEYSPSLSGPLSNASLLTDIYALLRNSPPLFSADELRMLGIQRVVIVGIFTGELEHIPLPLRRCFSSVVHLSTPVEKERFDFFMHHISSSSLTWWSGLPSHQQNLWYLCGEPAFLPGGLPSSSVATSRTKELKSLQESVSMLSICLASALALRSGGISYQGLTEMVVVLLPSLSTFFSEWQKEFVDVVCSPLEKVAGDPIATPQGILKVKEAETEKEASQKVPFLPYYSIFSFAQRIVQEFQQSHSIAASQFRSRAGYVDVQVTRWSDIAGLHDEKKMLQKTVLRPIKMASIYRQFGVRPSTGILLYGPPGTGKTMLAKAMATELNASFVYMDLPALIKAEVGESEKRLSDFFSLAKERSPAVLFMDELQAAFGVRYSTAGLPHSSSGVNQSKANWSASTHHESRLVSHLLQCMDNIREDWAVYVIVVGATNVIDQLDPLLLRAGRLDTRIKVPLPDKEARTELIRRVIYGDWLSWFRLPSFSQVWEGSIFLTSNEIENEKDMWRRMLCQKGLPTKSNEAKHVTANEKNCRNDTQDGPNERESIMSTSTAVKESLTALQKELTSAFVEQSDQLSGAELRNGTTMFAVDYLQSILLPLSEKRSNNNSFVSGTIESDGNLLNNVSLKVFDSMVESTTTSFRGPSLNGMTRKGEETLSNLESRWQNTNNSLNRNNYNVVQVKLKSCVVACIKKCIQMQWDAKAGGTSFYE